MKQKIKRILALSMAMIFAVSTCMTSGPYTVMATEEGQVTPGTEEGQTPGGSEGENPDGNQGENPDGNQGENQGETPAQKTYLNVKVVLGEGAGTIGNIDLGSIYLAFRNNENIGSSCEDLHIGETKQSAMEYTDGSTYSVMEIRSTNYKVTTTGTTAVVDENGNKVLVVTISKLEPLVDGTISGKDCILALSKEQYVLTGTWGAAVTEWRIEGSNEAGATVDNSGVVSATTGDKNFNLAAYCENTLLATKNIAVEKNGTSLSVTTSKSPASWKKPWDVTIKLVDAVTKAGIQGKNVRYTVEEKSYIGTTDVNGEIKKSFKETKHHQDTIKVTADFDGDAAYKASSNNVGYTTEKQTGTLSFDKNYTEETPLELTYGIADIVKKLTLEDENGKALEGDDTTVLKLDVTPENASVVGVNTSNDKKEITFHAKNASESPVLVTVTVETPNYKFSGKIYVKVNPYELTLDDTVSVAGTDKTIYDNTKIYDATSAVDVKATLKGDDALTEVAQQEVTDNFKDIIFKGYDSGITNVKGEEEEQNFTFEPTDFSLCPSLEQNETIKNNYVIKKDEKATAKVTIQKRTLKLTVGNTERPYRSLEYKPELSTLVSVNDPTGDTGFAGSDAIANLEGFTYPTVVDTTAEGLTAENVKANDKATCDVHTDVLTLDAKTGDPTGNYKFDFENYKHGMLTVTPENVTDATDYVTINNASSIHAYENEKHDRYYGKETTIKFALEGNYNRVYLANGTDITDSGLNEKEVPAAGTVVTELIYLANVEKSTVDGVETTTKKYVTNPFEITFIYDPDAPQCSTISFGKDNKVADKLADTITFGVYDNKKIEAKVAFSDALSGVKGWSYYVANTDKDAAFKDLITDEDYAEELVTKNFKAGDDSYTVPVGKLKDDQTLESNNYIVFVKVIDNVGNGMIYGSNGVVLENIHDITIDYKEIAVDTTTQQGTVDGRTYYSGDANLTLTAKENASDSKFYSGLEKMQYTISRYWGDGKTENEAEATESNQYGFPKDVTLAELQKYCTIEKLLELKNDPQKSQVVTVSATANDNAGNEMENRAEYTLVLDSIAPVVTSSYAQVNNGTAFLNGYYANSDVTYSVNVTERFLNELKVNVNGTDYTLEELKAAKDALGIKEITMDPVNDFAETKDSTVYKFTIVFHRDGEYTVQTKAADASGNKGEDEAFSFVIDTVRPEMQVTYTAYRSNGTSFVLDPSQGRAYANEEVSYVVATAVITERNFDAKDAKVTYTAVNSKGKDVSVADYDVAVRGAWTNKGTVSTEDNRYVYELALPTIKVDANYDFAYDYTDLAGNTLVATIQQAVTLDRVKPEGTVTVEDFVNGNVSETWNKLLNAITFGHFGKNSVRASMTSDDETAGVAATQYLTSTRAMTRNELAGRTDWTGYSSKISLAANQNLIVYEKIADKAGNIEYISTDGIIVDNVAPVPVVKITPTTPGWGKGVYSASDVPGFDINITDPVVNDAYAGLKTISYTITNGTTGYVESGTLANLDRTSHQQSWNGHVTIDPEKFYSNDVRVKVTADDWSTNEAASEEISIKVDNKAPIVTFSFDQSDVHNGKYYNNDKTLTITVDERNFDESYMPQVTSTAGGGYSISGWSHNGEIHTATVTFSGDSDYTVTYDCYDLAGNKSNTENLEEFTVDKTKPVIQVSYDNNSALNNNYYKDARTATITITEHNFNPGEVTVTTTAQLDGAAASAPGVSGWSGSGDTHVATVSYSADADYTFTISATDLASNVSDPYDTESFTVDQTKPTVEITNIEDHSANNGEVAPVVTLNDINFDSSKTVLHLTGANKGEVDTTGMYTSASTNKGQTITFHNFGENMDDIYTLTAETTDRAGNEYSTSKIFSVNRDGSTYMYDTYTEELIKNGYTNDPKDLVVSEINVDTLTFQELTVSENGTQKTLEQDKDYKVSESGSDVSWKEYKYTVSASNFENEGNYNVSIYSEDRATNVTTNTSKSKDILFAVDKTSPVISLANIEDGGRYKVESQKFTANVDDNMALDKVEYYVDGELKQSFDANEVAANSGTLELSVDSSSKFQEVSVKAYDKANNEATTATADVLVSASTWVQFYNNKPAFYGTIGGGIAVVVAAVAAGIHFSGAAAGTAGAASAAGAGGFFFLAGKKKKDDDKETK